MDMKTYRTVLIDPVQQSISVVDSDCSLKSIHKLVGAETLTHRKIAEFEPGGIDILWADDLGLMAAKPIHAFLLSNSKDPVAGKCLLIGADERGETSDAQMPVRFLREHVTWLGLIQPEVTWDYNETGQRAIVTYSRVKA
jgi:hypothetical protein